MTTTPAALPPARQGRAWRIAVRIAIAVIVLLVLASGSVYGLSQRILFATHAVPEHTLLVRTDSATVARGAHLATIRGCVDCHAADFGGAMVIDDPAVGRIGGANLTAGRDGGALADLDWERAVRHGVRRDGTSLVLMPSAEFTGMSDEDLSAIVAYVRTLPVVNRAKLPVQLGPVLRTMAAAGQVKVAADEIDHGRAHPQSVTIAPTAEYGHYLAQGCTGCHGAHFSGGKIPGAPPDWKPAANITPAGIGRYTADDFARVLRTGARPDGSAVDTLMPWRLTKHMTDTEVAALYAFLQTVPARPYGQR